MDIMLVFETSGVGSIPASPANSFVKYRMEINYIFQSFIAIDYLNLDNSSITNFCYDRVKNNPSRISSPWQSEINQTDRNTILKTLCSSIEERTGILKNRFNIKKEVELKITNMWVNVNLPNAISSPHKHPNHLFSGVYYPIDSANTLEIFNPIPEHQWVIDSSLIESRNDINSQYVSVEPKAGKLVMFPSWMMHYAKPNLDDTKRVSIAFDVDAAI